MPCVGSRLSSRSFPSRRAGLPSRIPCRREKPKFSIFLPPSTKGREAYTTPLVPYLAGVVQISSCHTVTAHIKKIYRKLQVHSRGEAVYEAAQLGILPAM